MGLPVMEAEFLKLAETAIFRSGNGIVLLILDDDTAKNTSYSFNDIGEVKSGTFTEKNLDLLAKTFKGQPLKVLVEVISSTNDRTLDSVLADVKFKKFNYLAYPTDKASSNQKIIDYVKAQRKENIDIKAVLANSDNADCEAIINFTTEEIKEKVTDKVYTALEYTSRIAGIVAGIPLNKSVTYYVLDEVKSIKESSTPDDDIDAGKLILVNDGEKIKIGRGVNSLQTIELEVTEDMKKIKIIEGMDLVHSDILKTFSDYYVGNYPNGYDDKVLFFSACEEYYKSLKARGVLNPAADATMRLDMEKQKRYITQHGGDVTTMSDQQIKDYDTGSDVFAISYVKFIDAMEDIHIRIFK